MTPVFSKDLNNINEKLKSSKLNNRIISATMLQQDQNNLARKIAHQTRSDIATELSDPKMLGAFLNSVNPSLKSNKGGRVTAIVAK